METVRSKFILSNKACGSLGTESQLKLFPFTPELLPKRLYSLEISRALWLARFPGLVRLLAKADFSAKITVPLTLAMTPFNREMKIFSGSAHRELALRICQSVGAPLGDAVVSSFPDGETRVKINENIRGRDIFIVQPTCPPTNQNLMELLILIDAARRASAYRITAVIPYFGYARQDRKDQPRVPITAKLVANLLVAAGASRVLTLDLHAQQIQGFFDIPVDHLYAAPVLIRYIRQKKIDNLVVVSPDVGGLKLASAYAEPLGATLAIVAKRRKSPTETEALHVIGDVEGKNVIMVDDLTETAGTLTNAATLLKKYGARDIYAGVSHAVFTDIAHERLKKSQIVELFTTDSTPVRLHPECRITVLSIAEVLGEGIHRICTNESVSSLFEINAKQS